MIFWKSKVRLRIILLSWNEKSELLFWKSSQTDWRKLILICLTKRITLVYWGFKCASSDKHWVPSGLITEIKRIVYTKTWITILEHKHASKYLAEQQTCLLDTWQDVVVVERQNGTKQSGHQLSVARMLGLPPFKSVQTAWYVYITSLQHCSMHTTAFFR